MTLYLSFFKNSFAAFADPLGTLWDGHPIGKPSHAEITIAEASDARTAGHWSSKRALPQATFLSAIFVP